MRAPAAPFAAALLSVLCCGPAAGACGCLSSQLTAAVNSHWLTMQARGWIIDGAGNFPTGKECCGGCASIPGATTGVTGGAFSQCQTCLPPGWSSPVPWWWTGWG
eukprot:gene47174-5887_t